MASAGGPANILANAHNVQIMDGTFSIVQGDAHYHAEGSGRSSSEVAIWRALRAVPNFRKIYQDMLGKATKGTGMWLFKNEKFRVWLEANGDIKIFWGSGMPGAGKTVLASLVIQHLETLRRASPNEICVCYFYFRYSDSTGLTVKAVLETLFKQTLERHPDAFGLVEQEYKQHLQEGTQPSEGELLGFLQKIADTMAVTFYVLDALDEAPPALQAAIVRTLSSLNVKLFITSRPLETVQGAFPQAHPFHIRADEGDIELHVTKGISDSPVLVNLVKQEGAGLRADILDKVKEKSDGMFLHAAFQMDALRSCVNLRQVRRILEEFPSQIEGAYSQTWNRILDEDEENVLLVKMVLVWVITATRSMTLEGLERAVAICPETFKFEADRVVPGSTFLAMCRGLLVVEEESQIVRLVHYTAKDQLQRLLEDSFPHPHSLLADVCIAHLTECGFQDTKIASEKEFTAALESDSLLAYSSEAWALHADHSLSVGSTKERVGLFVRECKAFPAYTSSGRDKFWFDILSPVHIIAVYHLPLNLIDGAEIDYNALTPRHQQSPLLLACESGYQFLVEFLLASPGIIVNAVDTSGYSALLCASAHGRVGITSLLLAHPDIQVNLVRKSGDSSEFSLMIAVNRGFEDIVKNLLAHPDIQVNLVDERGDSPLIVAVCNGHKGIVTALLAHPSIQVPLFKKTRAGPRPRYRYRLCPVSPREGVPLLESAVRQGYESIAIALLTHASAKSNLDDFLWRPSFVLAIRDGRERICKALIDIQNFDINSASWKTALHAAARRGSEPIVRLLLGIPNITYAAKDNNEDTAMSIAHLNGHTGIVKLLEEFEAKHSLLCASDNVQEVLPDAVDVVAAPPLGLDSLQELELERSAPSTHDPANAPEASQEEGDLVERSPRPDPPHELDVQPPMPSSGKPTANALEALAKEGDVAAQPPVKPDLLEPRLSASPLQMLNQRGGNRSKYHLCYLIPWTFVFVCGIAVLYQSCGLYLCIL